MASCNLRNSDLASVDFAKSDRLITISRLTGTSFAALLSDMWRPS